MPHAQDAVASRDAIYELLSGATFLAITVGRMAQDFYGITMHEVATLQLPDSIAITSSIMPQKKNMAALEHLKGRPAVLTARSRPRSVRRSSPGRSSRFARRGSTSCS